MKKFLTEPVVFLVVLVICESVPEAVYQRPGSTYQFICPHKKLSTNNVLWDFINKSGNFMKISDGTYITPTNPDKDRVSIVGNNAAGEFNLQLSDLRQSDEGLYRCSVNNGGTNLEKEYNLELYALPSSLALEDKATDQKIISTEGQSLTLKCKATGGKPPPLVTIIVDNYSASSVQSVEYTIITLQRRHDRLPVRCEANSSALISPLVDTATLNLYLKPLLPTFSLNPTIIEEDKAQIISCTSNGSRPAATFHWSIGGTNVTSDSTTDPPNIASDNTYTVKSALKTLLNRTCHGKNITCTAVNSAATNGVQASKLLDVKYAPDITVDNVTYNQKNDTRTVTCKPVGNPTTYTYYRWQHNSKYGEIIRGLDGGQNGVLTLPSVPEEDRYQDSGEYICTASNGIKDKDGKIEQTGSGYVIVNAQPVFTSGNKDTEYGEFGKDLDIHVYVYSFPKYSQVRWFQINTGTQILQNGRYTLSEAPSMVTDTFHGTIVQLNGYRFTLTIKKLVEADFNVSYRVELSNNEGQAVKHTILLLSASAPQTPGNITLMNPTVESVIVQWEAGYNGGHEQTFYVEYRVFGSSIWNTVKILDTKQSGTQTYRVTGLQDGTLYEFRMYSGNRFNKSSTTDTKTIETIKAESVQRIGPIIGGVAGGLAAVLVIIGIIGFVVFKRKQDTSTPSKATSRSKSDSEVPDGLQHNILYQSAGSDFKPLVPKAESGKKDKKPSSSETEYAEVQKPNAVYAEVDKTVQQKNVQDKKQKDKKRPKKPAKKANKAGNNNQDGEYANSGMSLKDLSEEEYANAENRNGPPTTHKNQQGLEYADLSFTKQIPQKGKKPVIHGGEDRTLYSEVDHSKKAPPPPQESAYEETNFKHG